MAKSSDRGGGPGSYTSNGVKCTMDPPFKGGKSPGEQHDLSGTFSHPRTGGANGLPTTVTDSMGGPSGGKEPGFASSAPSKDMDGVKTY